MKTLFLRQLVLVVGILSLILLIGLPGSVGQTVNWKTFENYVFGVANDAAQGKPIGSDRVDEIDRYLIAFISQGQCPTPEACESIKYIILTIRNIVSNTGNKNQQTAFLRQAVHNYTTSSQIRPRQNASPTQQTSQPQNISVSHTPDMLRFEIAYAYRPGGIGDFLLLKDGGEMHSGDHYKIIFQPAEDCYVYLFQVDTSGMIYGLFPLKNFKGVQVNLKNPVRGEEVYYIPAQDKSFKLDRQVGQERFYFLASRERDYELEEEYAQILQLQNSGHTKDVQTAQAQFIKAIDEKGPAVIVSDDRETETNSWQEDGQTFSVLKERLAGVCDNCVNILTFMHR